MTAKNHFHDQNGNNKPNSKGGKHPRNGHDDDASTITTVSSPEPEEYTYDRAIQGYMNFTETRVKSRPIALKSRKDSKVEEDIAEIERIQSRNHNGSAGDLQSPEKRLNVPKVDITKRKERFERSESTDSSEQSKVAPRAAGDLANSKSIRDRVTNLERHKSEENMEKSKQVKRLASDMSVKDRLSLLERQQSSESQTKSSSSSKLNVLVSPDDSSANPPSIKDRLISLKQVTTQEQTKGCGEISSSSVKKHFMDFEASEEKPQNLSPNRDSSCHDKLANLCDTGVDLIHQGISKPTDNSAVDSTTRFSSQDDEEFYHKRTFHRSLDSLDIDSSSVLSNEPYERVQSLEDLDSCGPSRHYPASASSNENLVLSSHSGDTDREDSGIHTADVSCSVSQADEPVDFSDMNMSCGNLNVGNGGNYTLDSSRNVDYAPPMIVSQLAKMNLVETSVTDKVVSRPEVVSSRNTTSSHSQVLVDLSNLSSKSDVAASKTYSSQNFSLPTILEVSHDSPPVVFVSASEPVSIANCTDASLSPATTLSPFDLGNLCECSDNTERVIAISQPMVITTETVTEHTNTASSERSCMSEDSLNEDFESNEATPLPQFGGSLLCAADDTCVSQRIVDWEEEGVSVSVLTESSGEVVPRPSTDKVSYVA